MRPMHGDDVTASLRTHVRHLSPAEAANVLSSAFQNVQRRRFRNRLLIGAGVLCLAFVLGFSLR